MSRIAATIMVLSGCREAECITVGVSLIVPLRVYCAVPRSGQSHSNSRQSQTCQLRCAAIGSANGTDAIVKIIKTRHHRGGDPFYTDFRSSADPPCIQVGQKCTEATM